MRLLLKACKTLCLSLALSLLLFLLVTGLPAAGRAQCLAPLCCSFLTVSLAMLIVLPTALLYGWTLRSQRGIGALLIRTVSALPSVLYGLLGLGLFVKALHFGWSLLSGSLTLAVMAFAPMTEGFMAEFHQLPGTLTTAALALGLEEPQIFHLALRQLGRRLFTRTCLLFSRLLGESAALLLTAGTVWGLPETLRGSGRTLSVHILLLVQEQGDGSAAAFASLVLLIAVALPTLLAKRWMR